MPQKSILLIEGFETTALPIETTFNNEDIQTVVQHLINDYSMNDLEYNQDTIIRDLCENGFITQIPGPNIMKITID